MAMIVDVGRMDLAVGGVAAALAGLMAPADQDTQEEIAAELTVALQRTAERPLDLRRLVMAARLAEVQALLLMLRSFRAAIDGQGNAHGDASWLRAAERSFEAAVQGETFLSINPIGLSSSWLEVVGSQSPAAVRSRPIAECRRRAEAVAMADLELALAPEPVTPGVVHHLTCAECAPNAGWFDAFGMFLGWQLRMKPHLLELMLGAEFVHSGKPAAQRLDTAFETARGHATTLERRLDASRAAGDRNDRPSCTAMAEEDPSDRMIRALSAVIDAPAPALAVIAERLSRAGFAPGRFSLALRQHAIILAAVHERWRRPAWRDFAPAHAALIAGRLTEAAQWGHTNLAETAIGLAEVADLEFLGGRYLPASDLYGRALEMTGKEAVHERLSLQLRLAEAVAFQYLTTGAAEARSIAIQVAETVCRDAAAANLASEHLAAARWVAELGVQPAGRERAASRVTAISVLDKALIHPASAAVSLDRVEAEAQRIELMTELAEIDAEGRQRHFEAAEKAARALASLDLSSLPPWGRELTSAAIGRGLLRPPGANVSDVLVEQAQAAFEAALAGDLARMDPDLAGRMHWRIAESHRHLAKGAAAKSRNEAGVIACGRALRETTDGRDRVMLLEQMRQRLVQLAKGQMEEWRLCQALAALNKAERDCPKDKPSWLLGNIFLQRSLIWARLRALSKDTGELQSALADADAAATVFREARLLGQVFGALQARAGALLAAGKDQRDPEYVAEAESVYARIISEQAEMKIGHRELCQTFMFRGDAADVRASLLAEPASRAAGRELARESYQQALILAVTHNLPMKAQCESALKKLEAA